MLTQPKGCQRISAALHVLVIDELAALTAYAEMEVRKAAGRLLSEVLTQGRALGVVVVAMVQDPRKETVGMRGLFTQTIALRLRSVEETRMVLGDGMARVAPAHRISPAAPGTGYVVGDDGAVELVRADFWPDELVRAVAARYGHSPVSSPLSAVERVEVVDSVVAEPLAAAPHRVRSARAGRRTAKGAEGAGGGESR